MATSMIQPALLLSAALFTVGIVGVLLRRNLITVFLCIELMLNAANLAIVALSRLRGAVDGQVLVFFVMTVAAAEAAVGLAIVIALHRHKDTLDADAFDLLKW
jgi:NADH-quinone oxidoreductase subunit K